MKPNELTSREAEEAIVASLLFEIDLLGEVTLLCEPGDFAFSGLRAVYETILRLEAEGSPIDSMTVAEAVPGKAKIETSDLVRLMNEVANPFHVRQYAKIVADYAVRRRIRQAGVIAVKAAHNTDVEVKDALVAAEQAMMAVAEADWSEDLSLDELLERVLVKTVQFQERAGEIPYLGSGFVDLDKVLGGWRPGLYLLLATTHTGKTYFVLNTIAHICEAGGRVLLFSMEQGGISMVERLLTLSTGIENYAYEHGLSEEQYETWCSGISEVADWDLVISTSDDTLAKMVSRARREYQRKPVDLIAVDPIGMISLPEGNNRNVALGAIPREWKAFIRQLPTPIILVHHVSDKAVASRSNKRPQMADPYESSHLLQQADVELGLYRPGHYGKGDLSELQVFVLKDRLSGMTAPAKPIELHFSSGTGAIYAAARKDAQLAF